MHPFVRKHVNCTSSAGQRQSFQNRSRNGERSDTEASLKEYEETIKATMEYNRLHPRAYNRNSSETPLKVKEGILLDSINTSIDSSTYNNKNRLGPNKENTFQCLKRSRSTSSMNISTGTSNSPPTSELQLNRDCDNPLRSKSRSINLPCQLNVNLDTEFKRNETTKENEMGNALLMEESSSLSIVNDHTMEQKETLETKKENIQLDEPNISFTQSDSSLRKTDVLENKSLEAKCSFNYARGHSTMNENTNFVTEEEINLDKQENNMILHKSVSNIKDISLNHLNHNLKPINKSNASSEMFVDKGENNGFKHIDIETVSKIKKILVKSALTTFPYQWMCQSFILNTNPKLQYGFVQNKGGACGVLATVQTFLLKALLFNPSITTTNVDPLRPTALEVRSALIKAFCDILWQAGQSQQAFLVCLSEECHLEDCDVYQTDGLTEFLCFERFTSLQDLQASIDTNLSIFTSKEGKGCLLLTISAILSRGITNMVEDMDDDACELIACNGTCALELVTLLLTGRAVSNVFDNNMQLDSCLLKGVTKRSDIGFLSIYEHYNSCQVGSNLKTPRYPIWLVNSGNHFSVIFSARKQLVSDWRAEKQFQLHHYDGMIGYNDEIILHIDTTGLHLTTGKEDDNVLTLDLCILTKWKDAAIKWTTNVHN